MKTRIKVLVPKTPAQIRRLSADKLKIEYGELAENYDKLIQNKDMLYCAKCGEYLSPENFYVSDEFKTGRFPICKDCILEMATDYDNRLEAAVDNRDKLMRVFHMLNLPYSDEAYRSFKTKMGEGVSVAQTMLAQIQIWAKNNNKTWTDSVFDKPATDSVIVINTDVRPEIRRIFGHGFTEDDYRFLQDQYDDWRARTQVDSKSQETYVQQICLSLLDIDKDRKAGKDVTNKLKALDILMNSANLQPKQNVSNAATDALTFGQLIEKWENERPISEPSEEFKDVDGIGKYIRVWFTGWLSKALGLKANVFTAEFDKEISQFEVRRSEIEGDDETASIYNEIFGDENGG